MPRKKTGIVVLSLFDGMSCGQIALERAGISVKTYYASEINKYAIKATMNNYPETIQLGDVCNVHAKDLPKIDLLIGGSPCQGFSRAGKGLNFDDPRSKLFFEYVRLWNEIKAINPNAKFLLENVRMLKEWENIISKFMGINPVMINSSLVSAQNRERLYWNNFNLVKYGLFDCVKNEIPLPKDKKIFLKDILESEVDEKYFLSEKLVDTLFKHKNKHKESGNGFGCTVADGNDKSNTISQKYYKDGSECLIVHNTQPRTGDPKKGGTGHLSRKDGKTYCLDTGNTDAIEINPIKNYVQWDGSGKGYKSQQDRAHFEHGKMGSISASRTENKVNVLLSTQRIRRLTPKECCRLQTVPDNYFHDTNGVQVISNSRIHECLGNGWTVDVISHQFLIAKPFLMSQFK